MEEDEEVDIVGGIAGGSGGYDAFISKSEREISNLSSGQILSCDYTVHPIWLADSGELWPENFPKQSSQDKMELVQDEVVIEEPAPIDFNWCEEISNCDDIILEKDIPATLEEEVVTNSAGETENDIFSEAALSSIEENPCNSKTIEKIQTSVMSWNPRSLLKNNINSNVEGSSSKFRKTLVVNRSLLRNNRYLNMRPIEPILKPKIAEKSENNKQIAIDRYVKTASKFRQSVKLKKCDVIQNKKFRQLTKQLRKRTHSNRSEKSCSSKSTSSGSGKRGKRFIDLHGENITISHDVEYGNIPEEIKLFKSNLIVEEVIESKIQNSDSDLDVDIESDSTPATKNSTVPNDNIDDHQKSKIVPYQPLQQQNSNSKLKSPEKVSTKNLPKQFIQLIESMDLPTEELRLNFHEISDLEKYCHSEFFEGRPTKTPERYMKIRRYILNTWQDIKPSYVTKTNVRNGLKHCGDVNCISRIHTLLEQIGAINFGHGGKQFTYIRPLSALIEWFSQTIQNKQISYPIVPDLGKLERRARIRNNNYERIRQVDANYTVSHCDGISLLVHSQSKNSDEDTKIRKRTENMKPEFQLIRCHRFQNGKITPFKVSITLSTFLCLQLHSLSSKHEVMGFLGGLSSISIGRKKLSLTRYKPCHTSEQNGTMCEMCPVSQVEQSSSLISEGYALLGWFHSHPAFPPNPSRTDVRTQAEMQHQFSLESDKPFIGFILGCMDMKYKCMYIMPEDLHTIDSIENAPYELNVTIINDLTNIQNEIRDVFNMIDKTCDEYSNIIKKFTTFGNALLRQYGHEKDILTYLNDIVY